MFETCRVVFSLHDRSTVPWTETTPLTGTICIDWVTHLRTTDLKMIDYLNYDGKLETGFKMGDRYVWPGPIKTTEPSIESLRGARRSPASLTKPPEIIYSKGVICWLLIRISVCQI